MKFIFANKAKDMPENEKKELHLTKLLSMTGLSSRRACIEMIKNGRISVNGAIVRNPAQAVFVSDKLSCDGRPLEVLNERVYVLLNKPRSYLCSSADPHHEKLAIDLIKMPGKRLFSAGRLDKDSEGMIIFSDDGDYVAKISHPRHRIPKRYELELDGKLERSQICELMAGIRDDGESLRAEEIKPLGGNKYLFVLREGKKREIRRMAEHAGRKTLRLRRTAIGKLEIGKLAPGKWRILNEKEVAMSLDSE